MLLFSAAVGKLERTRKSCHEVLERDTDLKSGLLFCTRIVVQFQLIFRAVSNSKFNKVEDLAHLKKKLVC